MPDTQPEPTTYCDRCGLVWNTLAPTWRGSREAWRERHRGHTIIQRGGDDDA